MRNDFGIWIPKGGYNDLFLLPAMKPPKFNDWPESNGIQVDLKAPKLESLTATVGFMASRAGADVPGFVDFLARPGYRAMEFPYLGRTFGFRLNETVEQRIYTQTVTSFVLSLTLDAPTCPAPFAWVDPSVRIVESAYRLDDTLLSDYGIFVTKGRNSLTRAASVKQNLTRNVSIMDGQLYDAGIVRLNSKEVTLQCCLKAATTAAWWSCRDALFATLMKPGERTLSYRSMNYPVFYRSMTDARLITLQTGLTMVEFSLNLTVIR